MFMIYHALVSKAKLPIGYGIAKSGFQQKIPLGHFAHASRIYRVAITSRGLGVIHGRIGVANQLDGVATVLRKMANADATSNLNTAIAELKRLV